MASKINVLFLHSQEGFGADSAIHAHLMQNLPRERHVVHVACSPGDGAGVAPAFARFKELEDVRVRPTQFAPGFHHRSRAALLRQFRSAGGFPLEFLRLRSYVRRHGIQVIHGTDRPRDAAYTVALARLTGTKAVVHVHVAWSEGYTAPAKWGVRTADGVFGISRFVTETIVKTGTPGERVFTILNGIDPSRWDPATDAGSVRRELGVPDGAPLLVSVSRLFAQKGQRELLRALALVRAEVPDVRLLVVGADAFHVHGGSFTRELKALAAELRLDDRVVFAGERSDIPRVMAASDVFSMPSFEEPFGLVFLEAMAMRKPVAALDNGGTPEVVEHGRSGLLSAAGDIAGFAQNIVALLRDRGLRDRMGEYGRRRVLDYFNARRMAEDASRAYEALVAGEKAPR